MNNRQAIIIGAGPAGLTAAYELLVRTDITPIVLEMSGMLGGIAQTVDYKGNRIDIGGHRFFSKSDQVMAWWLRMLPLQNGPTGEIPAAYQRGQEAVRASDAGADAKATDRVMLVRPRKSRIFYLRKFFDYPISLNKTTIANLGLLRMFRIALSYAKARALPIRNEQNLEQFLINRFGRELYLTFFKSYTEKVWGVPCEQIGAAWGAQRIKGLSIGKALLHALRKTLGRSASVAQKGVETSLIEQFLYPKFGPGQMWETCAAEVTRMGGDIRRYMEVRHIFTEGKRIVAVAARDCRTGELATFHGEFFFSTMPIQDLIRGIAMAVPADVRAISEGLVYRNFITVGLLLSELKVRNGQGGPIRDNWIYIQEPEVQVGRLQIFNNWSPYMVADPNTVWIGLEFFCYDTDPLWKLTDGQLADLGVRELASLGIIDRSKVLDHTVVRMPKTYPAYFGSYGRFDDLRAWLDQFENLFLVGRNGMHRYNNQDHSMLTAMAAVDNILSGRKDKSNIWNVNAEEHYHEEKQSQARVAHPNH